MAMVNPMLNLANVKDSRWLTLEVCREFQRNKCTRSETECKFAHPPPHVEVQNGRVTACFDSIKGKCQRKDPPCKYLHPPQHLREQLLQNGRNNLIIKNLQLQAAQAAAAGLQPLVPGMIPTVMYEASGKPVAYPTVLPGQYPVLHQTSYMDKNWTLAPPYISTVPTSAVAFSPYLNAAIPTVPVAGTGNEATVVSTQVPGVVQTAMPGTAQQKVTRADRLEGGMTGAPYPKRVAVADSKSGVPVYQPGNVAAYQQALAMQLQQQPYIPVTYSSTKLNEIQPYFTYSSTKLNEIQPYFTFAGHPPSVPRF